MIAKFSIKRGINQNRVVWITKYDADNFAMHRKFRYIVKFRYHSENFAIIAKFRYHREISQCSEISTYSENFAMIAKFPFSSCLLPCSSSLLFLHPRLDEIDENSYELTQF